jgi:hypothetical protein
MASLMIQIHPHRAPAMNTDDVRAICDALVRREPGIIERLDVDDGMDGHPYVNLVFESPTLPYLWERLQHLLYDAGGSLTACSIVTCEGKDGWNDYRLLHHFDPDETRDSFADAGDPK